ncbi:MAG TPA: preprotein translocase subunit SecY [Thermoplasmata archaeon]|nr:preprotein translocase subunit SecY [Thermoplasmata archaeon]
MAEEKQSLLYKLKPITDRMPAVLRPEGHVHFRTKLMWVIVILLLYFSLTNIWIYGLEKANVVDFFSSLRAILAGQQGSLMHLGIGPIVTGSIIMQLFAGAKIIRLDLSKDEDKAVYQGTQKLVVVIMIFVEAVPQVFGFLTPSPTFISHLDGFWTGNGHTLAISLIVLQLVAGSYLVFLMDEVVSKWGIGSGISLFIAAGVAQQIFTGTFNWYPANPGSALSAQNPPAGTIPKTFYLLSVMPASSLAGGGIEQILIQSPNPLIALVGTIVIFFLVAYLESTRIELPLAHGQARGARGRYPIRLVYASNIPVILVAAVLANVSMFSLLFWQHPEWPLVGHNPMIGIYPGAGDPLVVNRGLSRSTPIGGLAWYTQSFNGPVDWLMPLIEPERYSSFLRNHAAWQLVIHVATYVGLFIGGSVLFSKFWIETTDMGPEAVAKQIERSGMQIPGFRRDPRVLRRVLARYIPVVTVIGGATVGALAAGADMIGTVGNASGTGVLLTVGIMIQLYEAIGKEQMMEMHPVLRQFFGVE